MGRKWLIVALVAILGLVAVLRLQGNTDPWQRLVVARERALWMRHMPVIEQLIHMEIDSGLRAAFLGVPTAGYRENVSYAHGVLMNRGRREGAIDLTYLFDETHVDPRSVDIRLDLTPEATARVIGSRNEFATLLDSTKPSESASTTFMGMETFVTRTTDLGCNVRFKCSLPSPFISMIADYDRGDADSFEFEVVPPVLKFLRREAFIDENPMLFRYLPTFNPPSSVLRNGLGTTGGVILVKNGEALQWTLGISGTASSFNRVKDRMTRLRITSYASKIEDAHKSLREVFKARFLNQFGSATVSNERPVAFSGDLGTQSSPDMFVTFRFDFPIGNYRL